MKKNAPNILSRSKELPAYLLLMVSFIEGGSVMIVELLGAKIIAPYYGTSLYVWSSVLGVTLGALAAGYFLGGQISRKFPGEKSLFLVLLLGGFFTSIAPLIAPKILLLTESFGVRMGSLVSVLLYLFVPIMFLGSVSPIIIQLINKKQQEAGKSAGTVYAISTVGGIVATFLAGFYLIPEIGIKMTAYINGGVLFLLSLIYFIKIKFTNILLFAMAMLIIFAFLIPQKNVSTKAKIVYSSSGVLGEWTVLDIGQKKIENTNQIQRALLLNGIEQTYTQVGFEPLSLWKYPHKIAAYTSMKPAGSKALLLGMGGGSLAFELLAMGMDLDIVELDERIRFIAEEYFNYNPSSSNLYIDDARHYIRTTNKKYDIVVVDLLLGEVQPSHVFTIEGFEDLKKVINPDAIVIINFQGSIEEPELSGASQSIYRTLVEADFFVNYFSLPDSDKNQSSANDIYFIASQKEQDYKKMMQDLRYNNWFPYDNFNYTNLITEIPIDLSNAIVLLDDKPKLELLNASNILKWRKSKIDNNISKMIDQGLDIYN